MNQISLNNITNDKFDQVCRLCSSINYYLMSISSNEILPMIEECAPVNVTIGDNLPQSICQECYDLLEKILAFRKICIESETKFLQACNQAKKDCDLKSETVHQIEHSENRIESDNESNQNETDIENDEDIKVKNECRKEDEDTPNVSDCDNTPGEEFSDSDSEPLIKFKNLQVKPKKKYSKKNGFKCEICSKVFKSWKGIIYHMEHRHTVEPMKCSKCPRVFYYEPHLKSHLNQHELFKCEYCNQGFSRRIPYEKHLLTHGHKKPYRCSMCEVRFKTKNILRQHEQKIHKKRIKKVRVDCPVCHKKVEKYFLKKHILIHGTRGRMNCPNCPKTFYHQLNLDQHIRKVHENYVPTEETKNYLCNLCGIAKANRSNLERHLQSHATDRPFKCDKCPKSYKQADALKTHINNTHLNIRPYVCSECGLGFFTRRILTDHKRTHTGEKPFSCEICEQASFGSKAGLYLHMQAHHVPKKSFLNMFKFNDNT